MLASCSESKATRGGIVAIAGHLVVRVGEVGRLRGVVVGGLDREGSDNGRRGQRGDGNGGRRRGRALSWSTMSEGSAPTLCAVTAGPIWTLPRRYSQREYYSPVTILDKSITQQVACRHIVAQAAIAQFQPVGTARISTASHLVSRTMRIFRRQELSILRCVPQS